MARVSDDHADGSLCTEHMSPLLSSTGRRLPIPRPISQEEVAQHSNSGDGVFWAVIDKFVVDASEFVNTHPGGLRKLLSADSADAGHTGKPFGFSFATGHNAHFPKTGQQFRDGVQQYLSSATEEVYLLPTEVSFPPYGKIVILGKLVT